MNLKTRSSIQYGIRIRTNISLQKTCDEDVAFEMCIVGIPRESSSILLYANINISTNLFDNRFSQTVFEYRKKVCHRKIVCNKQRSLSILGNISTYYHSIYLLFRSCRFLFCLTWHSKTCSDIITLFVREVGRQVNCYDIVYLPDVQFGFIVILSESYYLHVSGLKFLLISWISIKRKDFCSVFFQPYFPPKRSKSCKSYHEN